MHARVLSGHYATQYYNAERIRAHAKDQPITDEIQVKYDESLMKNSVASAHCGTQRLVDEHEKSFLRFL